MLKRIFEGFWEWLFRKEQEKGKEIISGDDFNTAINRDLENPTYVFMTDNKYKTWGMAQMKEFLKQDLLDKKEYVKDWFDCDDFSFELQTRLTNYFMGGSHGIIWGNGHALNFFYSKDNESCFMIEPQKDRIYYKPKDFKAYLIIA